jgi:CMP-N,N'-diacetyllegionaminic acid synthase
VIGNKRLLAIIPARGGSKRLPRKNILELSGKPLIAWTIEAALGSKYIDHVVVSTEDKKIASISKEYGADVPFVRPDKLATDESASVDVVLHTIKYLKEIGKLYDYIILLQPTSPLRTSKNINESIELLQDRHCDAVISVCETEHSPLWCNTIPSDDDLSNFLDSSVLNKKSQDLKQYYRLNGSIFLCKTDRFEEESTFFLKSDCFAYKMHQDKSVDIDNQLDFNFASLLIDRK